MDLILNEPFIIKTKKIKEVVLILNKYIEEKLKNTSYYQEDKEYFHFSNLELKIISSLKTKKLIFKELGLFCPKLVILKNNKKINDFILQKDDWLIVPYDVNDYYESENKIYVFALS